MSSVAISKALNMSLDDVIKETKVVGSRGRGRKSRQPGTTTRDFKRTVGSSSGKNGGNADGEWKHDLYAKHEGSVTAGGGGRHRRRNQRGGQGGLRGTPLMVSNLHHDVSEADLRKLFEEHGPVIKAKIVFDKSGRSEGKATVVYQNAESAVLALAKYNGVPLDGLPLKIERLASDSTTGSSADGARQRKPSGKRTGPGRKGRKPVAPSKTAEELDAEMETYMKVDVRQ